MANPPIPSLTKRAPTIDFIDQKLPKHHPAFATQSVQYDPMLTHYVPAGQAMGSAMNNSLAAPPAFNQAVVSNLPLRPEWTDTNAMQFWNSIFPESMTKLRYTIEPKGRSQTPYDIRDKSAWDDVYNVLEAARAKYQNSGGTVGWVRRVRRKAADSIAPGGEVIKLTSKFAPQDNVATPVLGAIEVLFDTIKTAATVRNQVLNGFDGLVPIFSDVELFLSTFPGDPNIKSASIDLIKTTLEAIERAISFFISNEFLRGGKALLRGQDYEKDLCDCIEAIQTKARDLIQQALKTHIFESHLYSQETVRLQRQLDHKVDSVLDGNNAILDGTNAIARLLNDHVMEKDRELAEKNRLLQAARDEVTQLRVQNIILRSTSPVHPGMWVPPPQPIQAPALQWSIQQDTLRNMVGPNNIDLHDLDVVADKKKQLNAKDKARVEQIIHTHLFRNWIVSASSAKLLVHWDFQLPKKVAEVSPLSVFCMTMVESLRKKDRFLFALFFCGNHLDTSESGIRTGGHAMISSLIDQLLRQFQFDMSMLHRNVDLAGVQQGNLDSLTRLLVLLVRQLPSLITVFFIVDGVALFEREEYEAEAGRVFLTLVQLVVDPSIMASVKLLFTSTPGTDIVRSAFEEEDLILNVHNLPRLANANDDRTRRELEGQLDEEESFV